ncbi:DEKNAAC104684 [Brettanomyces naardenensis]|uniref:DEKNAAC104684 n=1 Tax=Brettanomyces naardenensis TaxID=13370 RepID=A0A448YRM4_BRENA|nr:DEKNAAC104684 [Brettanomyces naardenensis]
MLFRHLFSILLTGAISLHLVEGYTTYCKCQCDEKNYSIYELQEGETCKVCNADFCIDKNENLCHQKTIEESRRAITTLCFQRESTRDKLVVYGFLTIIATLLVFIIARRYL